MFKNIFKVILEVFEQDETKNQLVYTSINIKKDIKEVIEEHLMFLEVSSIEVEEIQPET